MKKIFCFLFFVPFFTNAQYTGTGSVTQGLASTTIANIYTCPGGRIPDIGTITATNATVWTVPAYVNFTNSSFPFASDLYNSCIGATYANDGVALAALNGSDIVTIDSAGELITAFIFADNYFEMYINGVPVGKDNVPYTQFNSNIIRFRVNKPFTIAMLLVDWEEHLGVGCENNNGFQYHMGDGGMVAVFKDSTNTIIETTGSDWKAQTFYTSPIIDLTCPSENGFMRLSNTCSTQASNNGNGYYGLHWSKPSNWMDAAFNDSIFPQATTYTNATVGISNKPAYTNFTNIFDDPTHDAQFIWSTNLILDNEVIVRHTVSSVTGILENEKINNSILIYPNPASKEFKIAIDNSINKSQIKSISIFNALGEKVYETNNFSDNISLETICSGVYAVKIIVTGKEVVKKLVVQ